MYEENPYVHVIDVTNQLVDMWSDNWYVSLPMHVWNSLYYMYDILNDIGFLLDECVLFQSN